MHYIARKISNDLKNTKSKLQNIFIQNNKSLGKKAGADIKKIFDFYNPYPKNKKTEKTAVIASFLPITYVIKTEGLFSQLLKEKNYNVICLCNKVNFLAYKYHKKAFGNKCYLIDDFIPWKNYPAIEKTINSIIDGQPDNIKNFRYKNFPLGISSFARISKSNHSGKIVLDQKSRNDLKKILIRSCLEIDAYELFLNRTKPDLVIGQEKEMPGHCELFYQTVDKNIDYIQFKSCHEPNSIMLKRYNKSNTRAHPFSISKKSWELIKKSNKNHEDMVIQEFEDGYTHNKWFAYKKLTNNTKFYSRDDFTQEYKLEKGKKIAVIFSHILDDTNLFYGDDCFENGFREWLIETVRTAMQNKNVNWVLKLHPANTFRRKNMGYTGEYGELIALKEGLGEIPENLKIIYPNDNINPLSLFKIIDYGITVRGTIGAEMPCFGKVALTAGTGRYSGFGFTEDSSTADEYLEKIRNIEKLPPISREVINLSIKHAYLFFFVRPAKVDTFLKDILHPDEDVKFSRDLEFKHSHYKEILGNEQANQIIDWMLHSKDEDFLSFNDF